ncbi:TlpA family protein disulfide reductase [Anaeromyxobacter paludicola]|uniref:Thioredoxin domain-containing protein n=1 Tax=Anaeromyxobacter paludicola TaxID=2918171 RepID=A0ABN6N6I3_9BACT|nr:deiodinase-like protein [Anaeromyxobacter paludicola]BDG08140.1 hypothetical protein AMPC_12530 [Anaeromyxobacter paludicola]
MGVAKGGFMGYRNAHFTREQLIEDLSFGAGRDPGWELPDFDLPATDGARVAKRDLAGRPALLTFASITDPMSASAAPVLKKLHRRFGRDVRFLTVYVREAHPGDRIRQPATAEWKLRHARMLRDRDGLPWQVLVDDLEGGFHRALGGNSNAAFLVDPNGRVAFRSLWSNDERVLGGALRAMVEGRSGAPFERERRVVPMARGLARVDEVVRAAGPAAVEDLRRETPLVFAAAELAWFFRALTPLGRAVVLGGAALLAGAALGGVRLARRGA